MQAESGGRAGSRPAVYGESQPFGEFIRTVLRYLPLVLIFSGLAGLGAFIITTPQPPPPTAETQVGLTNQVVWPFYDSARQRAVTIVEEPSFAVELTGRVARGPLDLEVEAPDNQAFVSIQVTAETPEAAALAADQAADLLLELDAVRLTQAAEVELGLATELFEGSVARVAEHDARLAELVPVEAEAGALVGAIPDSSEAREGLLSAELERTSITQRRNEELRRQVGMQIAVEEAQADVAGTVPELEILRRADPPDADQQRSYVPVIGAALAALIGGLAAAIMLDRTRGVLASAWHAEHVAGVTVLADTSSKRSREREIGLFLTGLLDGAKQHGNVIGLTGLRGTKTDLWVAMMVQYFQLAGIRIMIVVGAQDDGSNYGDGVEREWAEIESATDPAEVLRGVSTIRLPSTVMLLDSALMRPTIEAIADNCHIVLVAGGTIGEEMSDLAIALADVTVIVARKNASRVDQLRRAARMVSIRQEALLGVVLGTNRLTNKAIAQIPQRESPPTTTQVDEPLTAQWN